MDWRVMDEHLYINTRDSSAVAREHRLGIEIVDYLTIDRLRKGGGIRKQVDEKLCGIERRILHGPVDMSFAEGSPNAGTDLVTLLDETFDIALYHHVSKIVFHPWFPEGTGLRQEWTWRMAGLLRDHLFGKPTDIAACIENVGETEPQFLAALVDAIGAPQVSACLDIGHAHVNSARSLQDWIGTLGRRIGHVHLHSNDGLADRHWALGRGTIDMIGVLELLVRTVPEATYTLECDSLESISWLLEHCDP